MSETMASLRSILVDQLGISGDLVTEEAHLRSDLELDSTETVELVLELKRRLGVAVKFEARQDLPLSEICKIIDTAVAAKATVA